MTNPRKVTKKKIAELGGGRRGNLGSPTPSFAPSRRIKTIYLHDKYGEGHEENIGGARGVVGGTLVPLPRALHHPGGFKQYIFMTISERSRRKK